MLNARDNLDIDMSAVWSAWLDAVGDADLAFVRHVCVLTREWQMAIDLVAMECVAGRICAREVSMFGLVVRERVQSILLDIKILWRSIGGVLIVSCWMLFSRFYFIMGRLLEALSRRGCHDQSHSDAALG